MKPIRIVSARIAILGSIVLNMASAAPAADSRESLRSLVTARTDAEYPSLFAVYTNLHAHPELSFMEIRLRRSSPTNCARSGSR